MPKQYRVTKVKVLFLFLVGEAKSRGWVVGRVCLKKRKKIYISSLSARSKFVLGLVCFENFQSLIKKWLVLG